MFLGEVFGGGSEKCPSGFVCNFPVSKLGLGCGVLMGRPQRQGSWGTAGCIQGHLRTGGRRWHGVLPVDCDGGFGGSTPALSPF